ncbi:hypothetical protein JOD29_002568 [Lysinibacillus composti]|uniref:DUF5050 domain-containing protein n=2 Tax=Lysinibacillus composti TaxID=720633 RepID=A0A3N9UCF3_9BACI|nr:DUF5050 domain-containing protein [Lysinibacillus composti]MBM7609300.1 hypothetical protein [Lysinibacillus composti]RQW74054.1 DUF5050 domain-containing protein [Lysinibacillus composti]
MKKVYFFFMSLFLFLLFATQVSAEGDLISDQTHVYYVNSWDSKTGIYKEKQNGSGIELILPLTVDGDHHLELLKVKDGWVFYSYKNYLNKNHGIYKVQINGKNNTLIQNINYDSYQMKMAGSWIYYLESSSSNGCSYKLNRLNSVNLNQEQLHNCINMPIFEIADGYIYMNNLVKGEMVFTRLNLDGTKKHQYTNFKFDGPKFAVVGDWIYSRKEDAPNNVIRVNMKQGKQQTLTSHTGRPKYSADDIKVSNGYVYYTIWNDKLQSFELYRTKLDGTGDQKIGPAYRDFYISNNRIYSFSSLKEPRKIYAINGSKVTVVNAKGNSSTGAVNVEKINLTPKYGNQLYPGFGKGLNFTANFVLGKNKRIYLLEDNGTLKKIDGRLTNVHQFAETSGYELIVLKYDGTVSQWDGNTKSEKGVLTPAKGIKTKVVDISGYSTNKIGLLANGNVVSLVFQPTSKLTEKDLVVPGLKDIVQISASDEYSLALKKDGTVYAWGKNEFGQFGNGKKSYNYQDPTKISGLKDIVQIHADETYALALKKDGTVWAWGENELGQLGKAGSTKPIMLKGLSKIVKLSPGETNFAIDNKGEVWAWGANHYGQLGNGKPNYIWKSDDDPMFRSVDTYYSALPNPTPVKIKGISNVEDIAIRYPHQVIALTKNGQIWKWGNQINISLSYDGYVDEAKNEQMLKQLKLQLTPKLVTTVK